MNTAVPTPDAAVDVVIVNWNSGTLLRDCIAALDRSSIAGQIHVIVVDNASADESWDVPQPTRVRFTLIPNAENRGFGAACNQGAAAGLAPLILFLNPDTRIERDTLETAVRHFGERASLGVLGARLVDDNAATQRTCARRPSAATLIGRAAALDKIVPWLVPPHFMTEWDHETTRDVAQVMGAFLMIRRPLFVSLGGFDERFFVYYEDLDLCIRAGNAGSAVTHAADVVIWHQGQGTTAQVKDRRLFYILRSEALYAAKHHGTATALAVLALDFLAQVPLRVARALAAGRPAEARQVLRGAGLLAADLPRLLPRLARRT